MMDKHLEKDQDVYEVVGGDGSPYSVKMRAVFRYRRIPHVWSPQFLKEEGLNTAEMFEKNFPKLRARVIPVMVRPDKTYANDSTKLILELEERFHERPVVPKNPGFAFLAALLEDFADEWLTKTMFWGRFASEWDGKFGAAFQIFQNPKIAGDKGLHGVADMFSNRQVGRRRLVGCENDAAMEHTLRECLRIIQEEMLFRGNGFIFGDEPTNADFALYGQLRQSIQDPLPSKITHEYPAAFGWVLKMDDLSGFGANKGALKETAAMEAMLKLCSATYIPFLLANEKALETGSKEVKLQIFGGKFDHAQPPFKYQRICLDELRKQYHQLKGQDKVMVDRILSKTNCISPFSVSSKI